MLRANDCAFRFLVLFFNCMLTFGSYFCFDMPSVLQNVFQNPKCNGTEFENCSKPNSNCSCSVDGLGLTPSEYNLLYAVYAWTDAVVVIGAGFLIDKLGNRIGVFLFSFLSVFGSALFAFGAHFPGTPYILPIMLTGRLLFGAGNGSLTIVQNRITAFWFKNKELAMAFGITLAFSRLGSVLNFLLTESFADKFHLNWTLWGGTMLCGLGFISAFFVSFLDIYGVKQLGQEASLQADSKKVKFTDIKNFSLQFWLLTFTLMFFYNGVFPFIADASDFIQTKYNVKDGRKAAYIAGAAYDVSMLASPFLGRIIDTVGWRGYLALSCALLTIPVYAFLAFGPVAIAVPIVCVIWLGVTYSCAAASMWPSIPLVVSHSTVGTAMGITTGIQMVGIGICNVVVGAIMGKNYQEDSSTTQMKHWKYVMIFLLANTICCAVTASFLNVIDNRRGGVLNQSRSRRQLKERLLAVRQNSEGENNGTSAEGYQDNSDSAENDDVSNDSGLDTQHLISRNSPHTRVN